MRKPVEWGQIDLGGDPVLVIGWRGKGKRLEAVSVSLRDDTYDAFRSVAATTLEALTSRDRDDWHPNAHLEPGEEYLSLSVESLPVAPVPRRTAAAGRDQSEDGTQGDHQLTEAAQLLQLVMHPGDLVELDPSRLRDGHFTFYALVWEDGDNGAPVAFIAQYDPTAIFRKSHHFFRYEGTLRVVKPPDFALGSRAEMVVTTEEIAVLQVLTFDRLFSDVRALLNDVPTFARHLDSALTHVSLTENSINALVDVCQSRPSLALRLHRLASDPVAGTVTATKLREVLTGRGHDPDDFLTGSSLDLGVEQVRMFLDLAEGRLFRHDLTGEQRRASKWSRQA